MNRQTCIDEDRADPLARCRDAFLLRDGLLYLDGNSLGPPQQAVLDAVDGVTTAWRERLINAWWDDDWVTLPARAAARIAPLIGALPHEVMLADSVSVNLFKVLGAALNHQRGRTVILTDADNFPSDLYIAKGLASLQPYAEVRAVPRDQLEQNLGSDVAVLAMTHVDFRSGARVHAARLNALAHRHGVLTVWDLSHSTGALEVDVHGWGVDLAVGCTYKFLSAGPGAPGYVYVDDALATSLRNPVAGWFGHDAPFDFSTEYVPAPGAARFAAGTPTILGHASVHAALAVWDGLDLGTVERKVAALTGRFLARIDDVCPEVEVITPRDASQRGAQITIRHDRAARLTTALASRDVIVDHRPPDLVRFGFSPLFLRHVDAWDAVERLRDALDEVAR